MRFTGVEVQGDAFVGWETVHSDLGITFYAISDVKGKGTAVLLYESRRRNSLVGSDEEEY